MLMLVIMIILQTDFRGNATTSREKHWRCLLQVDIFNGVIIDNAAIVLVTAAESIVVR